MANRLGDSLIQKLYQKVFNNPKCMSLKVAFTASSPKDTCNSTLRLT
jgi:hypothetical protein